MTTGALGAGSPRPLTRADARNREQELQRDFSPIFIVGFPRSGTTLLATLLSRHTQIAVPPETRFLEDVVGRTHNRAKMLARVAGSKRCQALGLNLDVVAAKFLAGSPTYSRLFRALLETYADKMGKTIVAEKTPIHLLHIPTLVKWYPTARFLLIVRDGRDCVLSLRNVRWTHDNIVRNSAEWRWRMKRARRLLRTHARSIRLMRYEDLVLAPERELRRAMDWLELPFEKEQLFPSEAGTPIPSWESKRKAEARGFPDRSSIASWRREAHPKMLAEMETVMRKELVVWGYEVEGRKLNLLAAVQGAFFSSWMFRVFMRAERSVRKKRSASR